MSTTNTNTEWIPQQIKVFSRWFANHLSQGNSDVHVNDITKDLSNGVALIELAEILTHKDAPANWAQDPKHLAQMVTNNDMAIDMFTKDGVHFVGISGKDIHDSKEKLVLGLVWTLILHYSIGQSIDNDAKINPVTPDSHTEAAKRNKEALMQWAIDRTHNYPNVNNFQPYDLSMCALLDSYVPEKVNFYSLDRKDTKHNAELATRVMEELGIPVYLDSDDLQETTVDEKALLTQLSTAKVVLERISVSDAQNVEEYVSNFNESTATNEEVLLEECKPIPQPLVEETNIVNSVNAFNQSNHVFEEVVDDADTLEARTRDIQIQQEHDDDAMREIEESMRRDQEENKNLPDKIVIDGLEFTNIRVREISLEPKLDEQPAVESSSSSTSEDEDDVQTRAVEPEFVPHTVEGDNSQYAGRKFGLVLLLNENDYNEGRKIDLNENPLLFGEDLHFALTMVKDKNAFLNPAGLKLSIAEPNIENDVFQQFTFGKDNWNTVIDSVQQQGMVWDVADEFNTNPPSGTPFYLFPFHGRHNQHFVYKDGKIYAQQNGQVVTFVGGDEPLVMMPPSNQLKARQTFTIQLL